MEDHLSLRNHIIVCGVSPTSHYIVEELEDLKRRLAGSEAPGNDYVLIDPERESIDRIAQHLGDLRFLVADPTDDRVLEQAGIQAAYGIFPLLPSEKDNLYITIAARQQNSAIRIVASTADPFTSGQKFSSAGASAVISPNFIGGLRLVSEAARPAVTAFLDQMLRDKNPDLQICEIEISPASELCGHRLDALRLPQRTGLLLLALLKKGAMHYTYNPGASALIAAGDIAVVLGSPPQVETLRQLAG